MKNTLKLLFCFTMAISFAYSPILNAKEHTAKYSKKHQAKKSNPIEEEIKGIKYNCAEKQKFIIQGDIINDNNLNLYYNNKKPVILSRIDTQTGVNRFVNNDRGFDLVVLPIKSMLLDTKLGRRVADECIPLVSQSN